MERSIQNIQINNEQLLELVRKAGIPCCKIDECGILSGGALNTTYRFTIDSNKYVLRLYARDRALCKTEKTIHQLIDGHVSTPRLIYADESHEPWAYSIFEFISGKHISEISNEYRESLSYELGHVLATIHNFKLNQAGLFGDGMAIYQPFEIGSNPYFEEAFTVLSKSKFARQRLGDKLADETLAFMQKNKDCFPLVGDNVCLTHSDFKPVNLLYNGEKVFVLDWEFAHAGIGLLDFAILLRHREQFPLDLDVLSNAYTDFGGKLPEDWFRSALITDFINIVQLLDSPPKRPKLFHQLINTIQNTMKNW